jgi:hypothetical protein
MVVMETRWKMLGRLTRDELEQIKLILRRAGRPWLAYRVTRAFVEQTTDAPPAVAQAAPRPRAKPPAVDEDALAALRALGFHKSLALQALRQAGDAGTTEEKVLAALRLLGS